MSRSTLKQRCERYEAALAGVAEAVITTDSTGLVLSMNRAAETLLDCGSREAIGQPLEQLLPVIHDEYGEAATIRFDALQQTRLASLSKHGREVVIEYSVIPVHDGGMLTGSAMVVRDITRRRSVESALRYSEQTLLANEEELFEEKERAQVTLNSIGDAVICTDFRGCVSYLNIVAEKMTGWTHGEASERTLDEVVHLVDSATRTQVPDPTTRAIIENTRIDVEADCVLISRDGTEIAVEGSAAPIHDKNGGVIGAVMVAHDVTAARALSSKLARLALHDSLTDLPNRALFNDRFAESIVNARTLGSNFALLYVDLDRFKQINDSLGHAAGDTLLRLAARRMVGCVRSSDTVSRQGGDEFLILLTDILDRRQAAICAEKVILALGAPYQIGDQSLHVTASVGIAVFPEDAADAEALVRCADSAMYRAKKSGCNTYMIFERQASAATPGEKAQINSG